MYGHRLLRELVGLLFLFCGLLMLLSLWTYSIHDPSFNQAVSAGSSSVQNSAGIFGAYLSGFLVDMFGAASFLWVVFFLAVGAGLVSRWLVIKWYRWIGCVLLFLCSLVLGTMTGIGVHDIHGGGFAGRWVCSLSYKFLSPVGSVLFWIFVFLVAMELSFRVSWLSMIAAFLGWLGRKIPSLGRFLTPPSRRAPLLLPLVSSFWKKKQKKEEPPRPVLDIIAVSPDFSEKADFSEPLSLEGEEASSMPASEPYSGAGLLSLEDVARLVEQPDISQDSHQENTAQGEFILELEDVVDTPMGSEGPLGAASPEEESPSGAPLSSTAGDRENSSGSDLFSDGKRQEETVLPLETDPEAAVLPEDSLEGKMEDEAYASVGTAVAAAMKAHAEMEEANRPVEEEAPAPVLPSRKILPLPPLDLLDPLNEDAIQSRPDNVMLARQGEAVITCLKNFNVNATLARITPGPVITMFEVRPAPGVKATRITNLADDLAMSLKAAAVRMQAPVPGTDTVGVEVPNERRSTVYFREIVENESFRKADSLLTVAVGKDTGGRPFSADLARMPHLLVAGATGQGKSVCLNAILLSLLYRARPDEVQLILVDPKRVEFSMYADLPHLVHPVVTDMDLTKNALLWAIDEMNRRLSLFSKVQVRNITGYNERQARLRAEAEAGRPVPRDPETGGPADLTNMPFLVIVVDELADLMMLKRKEVEGSIVRLAQLARAAGIHLIIATQRPSVDVVTGLIKANFPCRIAFKVTSSQDSRTILDGMGAEKLLGMGDMLFKTNTGAVKRIHGAYVSDNEVSALVDYWKKQQKPNYKVDFSEFGDESDEMGDELGGTGASRGNDIVDDPIYSEAIQFVLDNGKVSISLLQRRFRIGFNRAARIVEQLEKDGILGQADGTKPRSVVRR